MNGTIVQPSENMLKLRTGLEGLVTAEMPSLEVRFSLHGGTNLYVLSIVDPRRGLGALLGKKDNVVANLVPGYNEDGTETGYMTIETSPKSYVGMSYYRLERAAISAGYEVAHRVELEQ